MKRLVIAEPAARDLAGIIDYIAFDNPAAAQRVYGAIAASARRLVQFPEMGRPGRLQDTRELSISSLPYLIVYRVGAEEVTVIAVFHTARDLSRALGERATEPER